NDDKGTCEHCSRTFSYMLLHNGFNDSAYAYCDTCGSTAALSVWSSMPAGVAVRFHQRISSDVESHLRPCACGGRFRADASPRCPHCRGVLSPVTAASWIEANAPGTAK